jgi:hypothetical protein
VNDSNRSTAMAQDLIVFASRHTATYAIAQGQGTQEVLPVEVDTLTAVTILRHLLFTVRGDPDS